MAGSDIGARRRFAANIELLREREGLSLARLAERSQVDRGELAGILCGEREASAGAIYMIAGALGVDPGELFAGVTWDPPATGGSGYQVEEAPKDWPPEHA
jgi:transcriptional regulator with XRE-family HTH domain